MLVGSTATGKSRLAIDLVRGGLVDEIVSADSMQVYVGMDIGTAKPTGEERAEVPHHLLDVAAPSEEYSVSRFVADADRALADIGERHARPVVAGGTGLYVQALIDRFDIPGRFAVTREALEREPNTRTLYERLVEHDPIAASRIEPDNRRRIVRALEVTLGSGRPFSSFGPGVDRFPATDHLIVGLDAERDALDRRIDERFDRQMEAGLLTEVAALAERGLGRTAAQALGYKELLEHLHGSVGLDEAVEEAKRRIRRFARRQQRWFRRDPRIEWIDVTNSTPAKSVEETAKRLKHWSARNRAISDTRCT